ncbi:hypothetical protein MJO28_003397 [Puccinia striiformis f. sp. tritici]|uniref:Uncharacterized protein n=1 Tax=Puccinia striiformis f. sp. tritici TaxID=168172 RepID=A0ACC0ESB9_9BASI|nr:hypothetical protein MJO28_003397 [Puccinia striiformis f. sp. tritici]
MIFIWGLVQSCKGKNTFAMHARHEDSGIFRPSYGNLGGHLLFQNENPILLLSATCQPAPFPADLKHKYPTKKRKFHEADWARLNVFKDDLVEQLAIYFGEQDCAGGEIGAGDFFGPNAAKLLVTNLHIIECPSDIRKLIGGECFVRQLQWLIDVITIFKINQEANPASQQGIAQRYSTGFWGPLNTDSSIIRVFTNIQRKKKQKGAFLAL